jgi:glutamyl-tRNA reductase
MDATYSGIAALHRRLHRVAASELDRALARLEHLSAEDRAAVARLSQRMVDTMVHNLISRVRSLEENLEEYDEAPPQTERQVLARLFADPDAPADPTVG